MPVENDIKGFLMTGDNDSPIGHHAIYQLMAATRRAADPESYWG
jgi:hypothetical protein